MLATAAMAHADPQQTLSPPGMTEGQPMDITEGVLTPPGLTPPVDCADDPNADDRDECQEVGVTINGGVIRGGFGHYFWVSGG